MLITALTQILSVSLFLELFYVNESYVFYVNKCYSLSFQEVGAWLILTELDYNIYFFNLSCDCINSESLPNSGSARII